MKVRLGIVAELTNPFVRGKVLEMLQLQVDFSICVTSDLYFHFDTFILKKDNTTMTQDNQCVFVNDLYFCRIKCVFVNDKDHR